MSDQDTSMFTTEQPTPAQQVTPDQEVKAPTVDVNSVFASQLSEIKNEKGEAKYADVATALEALKHSQNHIATLQQENERFRTESTKAATMEEVLAQINTAKPNEQIEQTSSPALGAEDVRNLTVEALREYEATRAAKNNQDQVVEALKKSFGDKAEEMYNIKAKELGVSVNTLNDLAASSPKAVLAYFSGGSTAPTKNVEGSVSTDALGHNTAPQQPSMKVNIGATNSDLVSAWRAAGKAIEQ